MFLAPIIQNSFGNIRSSKGMVKAEIALYHSLQILGFNILSLGKFFVASCGILIET